MNRKLLATGTAALMTAGLGGMGVLLGAAPTVQAASKVVTLTYPANDLGTLDPVVWDSNKGPDGGPLFEGLYGIGQKNQVVPKIATKAVPSQGGRVWTIYMRHNARWSNGQPVVAADFKYAWLRCLSPTDTSGAPWAGVEGNLLNGWAYNAGAVPASKVGVQVVNNYELKITLDGATNITGLLALTASMPVYPPAVKAHPTSWLDPKYFVGDGPYVLKKFVPNGEVIMTRNPKYVGGPGYNVGNVQQIDVVPGPTVEVEDYQAGALDAAHVNSPSNYSFAKTHFPSQIHIQPMAQVNYLGYDHSVLPSALDKPLVRQAIAMAINRQPIATKVLAGLVGQTSVFAYPGFPTYKYEHNPYSYNVAAARKLLAKAGYPGGKGVGQLYLYTYTSASSATDIPMAEAVAEELKNNLGLNFKIMPTNATEMGVIIWAGTYKGILPGYSMDIGSANWNQTQQWPLQSDQWVTTGDSGDIPAPGNFQKYAENWNFYTYDPNDVKAWGNPNNTKLGVSYSQWLPILAAAKKDMAFLTAWTKKQPMAFQKAMNPPGTPSGATVLGNFEKSYKTAKTPTAKHAAWVALWKYVGSYAAPGGGAYVGLNAQVYIDKYEPPLEHQMRILEAELGNTASAQKSAQLSGEMGNLMMKSGLDIPLNYQRIITLEKPFLTGVQSSPYSGLFYQYQYLKIK